MKKLSGRFWLLILLALTGLGVAVHYYAKKPKAVNALAVVATEWTSDTLEANVSGAMTNPMEQAYSKIAAQEVNCANTQYAVTTTDGVVSCAPLIWKCKNLKECTETLRAVAKNKNLGFSISCLFDDDELRDNKFFAWAWQAGDSDKTYVEDGASGKWTAHGATQLEAAQSLLERLAGEANLLPSHRPVEKHVHQQCPESIRGGADN